MTHEEIENHLASHLKWLRTGEGSCANFSGADMRYANLRYTDLRFAILVGTDLTGADFSGSNLSKANFSKANLSNARLNGTELTGASFVGANLSGADVDGSTFMRAAVETANLSGTKGILYGETPDANLRPLSVVSVEPEISLEHKARSQKWNDALAAVGGVRESKHMQLAQEQINVDLFDECKRLRAQLATQQAPARELLKKPFFIFDVEAIGLHGDAFAVAGGVYIAGIPQTEFRFCCPLAHASGDREDVEWVRAHVPEIPGTHETTYGVREAFWGMWKTCSTTYPDLIMAAECLWPVEANFISACIANVPERKWKGPYPFHDIATILLAAGMDPLATYEREADELPAHEPLADTRQSARLLATALRKLAGDTVEGGQ